MFDPFFFAAYVFAMIAVLSPAMVQGFLDGYYARRVVTFEPVAVASVAAPVESKSTLPTFDQVRPAMLDRWVSNNIPGIVIIELPQAVNGVYFVKVADIPREFIH